MITGTANIANLLLEDYDYMDRVYSSSSFEIPKNPFSLSIQTENLYFSHRPRCTTKLVNYV